MMSDTHIPGLPERLEQAPGVIMNSPPAEYMERTNNMILSAVSQLGATDRGALTWIATRSGGKTHVNLAIVQRVNDRFQVVGWVGKTFGEPIAAGVAGKLVW